MKTEPVTLFEKQSRWLTVPIFLVFFFPVIQLRIDFGPLSIASQEIPISIGIVLLLIYQVSKWGHIKVVKDPLVLIFIAYMFLAIILRPWSYLLDNVTSGFTDLRGWVVPVVAVVAMLGSIRLGWRKISNFLILIGLFVAVVGIYQFLAGVDPPFLIADALGPRNSYFFSVTENSLGETNFGAAFFTHPGTMAQFLSPILLVTIGWYFSEKGLKKVLIFAIIIIIYVGIYITFSRTSFFLSIVLPILYLITQPFKRIQDVIWIGLVFACVLISIIIIVFPLFPQALFDTIRWRMELWTFVDNVIIQNPSILLIGNGMIAFGNTAFYESPHNLFFHLLLEYGLLGLTLQILLIIVFFKQGIDSYKMGLMSQEPILRGLWFAILFHFLIGIIESMLLTIEARSLWLLFIMCYVGLQTELRFKNVAKDSLMPSEGIN